MDQVPGPRHTLFQGQGISVPSPTPHPSFQNLASQAAHPLVSITLGLRVTLGQACRLPPHGWELPEAQMVSAPHLPPLVHPHMGQALKGTQLKGRKSLSGEMLIPSGIRRRGRGAPGGSKTSVPSLSPHLHFPSPLGTEQQAQGEPSNFPDPVGLSKPI